MEKDSSSFEITAEELIERWDSRRNPLDFGDESLPPLNSNLDLMARTLVPESATQKVRNGDAPETEYAAKCRRVAEEFVGNSQLAFVNAILIGNLRRRAQPYPAVELFQRIWKEKSDHMLGALDLRWKVSSVITFADHGCTDMQRELGRGLQVLFGMMKLYEHERTHSGTHPNHIWSVRERLKTPLALEMNPFSLRNGGLDSAILAPLWVMAKAEPVMGPLACDLLERLNKDDRNIFYRLRVMTDRFHKLSEAGIIPPRRKRSSKRRHR